MDKVERMKGTHNLKVKGNPSYFNLSPFYFNLTTPTFTFLLYP